MAAWFLSANYLVYFFYKDLNNIHMALALPGAVLLSLLAHLLVSNTPPFFPMGFMLFAFGNPFYHYYFEDNYYNLPYIGLLIVISCIMMYNVSIQHIKRQGVQEQGVNCQTIRKRDRPYCRNVARKK
ncbi:MAG: hypothetical protein HC896_17280, partial [Bacteroidales bacterium]|nr:hypothetical protein [Bacteroidales bacterium]